VQEGRAEKAIAAIRDMLAPEASVIRAGERHTVAADTLVPGDVVLLEAGDKVPRRSAFAGSESHSAPRKLH